MLNPQNLSNGQEQHEIFSTRTRPTWIQYDYRHTDGELFSCVARTLEICVQKRNAWINTKVLNSIQCPECLNRVEQDELDMFAGLCETCSEDNPVMGSFDANGDNI